MFLLLPLLLLISSQDPDKLFKKRKEHIVDFLKKGGPQLKKAMEEAEADTQNKGNYCSSSIFRIANS